MNITFQYQNTEHLNIDKISVIGDFNNFNPSKGHMIKENNVWTLNCNLPSGEHHYKFLINDSLELNDPTANIYMPREDDILWSLLIIDKNDNRLYNNTQYTVHIDKYNINSNVTDEDNISNKKNFNIILDKKVVTRFKFTNVTGLHEVTTAWYSPKGDLFQTTANNLFKKENDLNPVTLWFWLDIDNMKFKNLLGNWTVKLFIDGEYILEDNFELLKGTSYSAQGKIKY
ncbi:hypothetical protein [Clostridium massiliodielmoense]|uniref:hypothetical protein n=1 Tax=Clostridium massiliodielmoense TaxID=1776385 RepID=UPI000166879F|nr:hypothetical protein [Clostridium massiliodielmoense]EDS77783.1 conserved hypothetical protein [Clostridium botulinum C str. Eklund]KEH96005.1 hypothetical protein Z962_07595 [Clostridium botulinum C/D str. BKT12695]NEZ49641.1 hypothetical protein [Clostridium botulinum]